MRSERSIISGLGAAASLLAAIALASFVTATLVTFNGWPHARATGAPRALIVASNPERVAPIVAGARRLHARVVRVRARRVAHPQRVVRPRAVHVLEHTTAVAAPPPVAVRTPPAPPARCACPVRRIIKTRLTDGVADTTEGATTTLGDTVKNVGGGLGGALAPVSQPVGSIVQGLTKGLGGTVTVVGQSLALVLRGLTPQR